MQKIKIGGPPPELDPAPENVTATLNVTTTNNSTSTENSAAKEIKRRLRGSNSADHNGDKPKPRLLCVVYTYDKHHETMLQAIVNTWAWHPLLPMRHLDLSTYHMWETKRIKTCGRRHEASGDTSMITIWTIMIISG